MVRRLLTVVAVGAGLVVAVAVVFAAFSALKAPVTGSASTPSPQQCSPAPCANVQGYRLWISNVQVQGGLVRMTLKFQNSSPSTHASPQDVEVVDSASHVSGIVTDATGCHTWARHEFNGGATFGPIDVCFRIASIKPPLSLRWTPDLGFFCCDTTVSLPPS